MKSSKSGSNKLLDKLFRKKSQPEPKLQISLGLDINHSHYNVRAAEWAFQNAGSTYPDLNQEQREAIRQAVVDFIKRQPGFTTVGTVWKLLSKYFDEEKAELIATTEITRAYAHAAQIEGEELKKEFPDVRVIKTWFTCNDHEVCDVCAPLNGKEVDINKPFAKGVFIPPAHDGCRCSISSRTRING